MTSTAGCCTGWPPGTSGPSRTCTPGTASRCSLLSRLASARSADELVAASPTGVRAVLLARLTLVLGTILGAASAASLGLAWSGAGAPLGLFAAWLGPMALLSAVSFALSPREFLDYVGLLKGLDDTRARRRQVDELLELVALTDVAGRRMKGFSGGMRRRVGIAQALLGDPALIVVDEPTAGLDPEERVRFRTLLSGLAGHRTVLLSTHIVEDVAQTCQHAAVMAGGRVVYTGMVTDLVRVGEGATWEVVSAVGAPPPSGVVVSAIGRTDGTHYRVVSPTRPGPDAVPVAPSLEDGYVALMQSAATRARTVPGDQPVS